MKREEWRFIVGYEGLYMVSNYGRVKRLWKTKEVIIKGHKNGPTTHQFVQLCQGGITKKHYIHRLVAFAFPEICGEWFEGAECNHVDENPENNCAWNLEWVTHKYNNAYGTKGEKHSKIMSKQPVVQYDLNGNVIRDDWPSAERAGKELKLNPNHIRNCCKNMYGYKTCGGFKWAFK